MFEKNLHWLIFLTFRFNTVSHSKIKNNGKMDSFERKNDYVARWYFNKTKTTHAVTTSS